MHQLNFLVHSLYETQCLKADNIRDTGASRPKHAELMTALLTIWNDLPQEFIDKALVSF